MSGKKSKKNCAVEAELAEIPPRSGRFGRPAPRTAFTSKTARLAGFSAALSQTQEQRSANARHAAKVRHERERAAREAAGLPPRASRAPLPSANELAPWIRQLDELYPDRQWSSDEERRRQAQLLYRQWLAQNATRPPL